MKATLPNGLILEGTLEQVLETASKLGFEINTANQYYYSKSRGEFIPIETMNTTHLRNAILRQYEDWVKEMHKINNPKELVKLMLTGISDTNWLALVKEYAGRPEEKPLRGK